MDEENIHSEIIMRGDGINFPLPGDIVRVKYTIMLPDPEDAGDWGAGAFATIGGEVGDLGGGMGGMGVNGGLSLVSASLGGGGSTSLAGATSPGRGGTSSRKGKGKQSGKVLMSTKNTLERPWVEFVLGIGQCIYGFDRALPLMSVGERTKFMFSPQYAYGSEGLFPHIPPNTPLIFDITLLEFRPRSNWVKPLIQDLTTTWEKPYFQDLKLSLERFQQLQQTQKIAAILSASVLLNEGVDGSSLTDLPAVRNVGGRGAHHTTAMASPNPSMASPGNSVASGRTSFKM
ncbi:FKBP-type peptidyl-prolyl cis-trans isomerase [archaeon]|nr:MAG: FKBP-type peptidyl-prolyl cis-trans isomerase [archaeon]